MMQNESSDLHGEKLITLAEYAELPPYEQGFAAYWQGEVEGSELKTQQKNPYHPKTNAHREWDKGQTAAVLAAQDSEE